MRFSVYSLEWLPMVHPSSPVNPKLLKTFNRNGILPCTVKDLMVRMFSPTR